MPIYEYQCIACGLLSEIMQKYSDPPPTRCKACQGKIVRVFSPSGLVFKGSGWYVTDYSAKGKEKKTEGAREAAGTKQEASPVTKDTPKDAPKDTPKDTAAPSEKKSD